MHLGSNSVGALSASGSSIPSVTSAALTWRELQDCTSWQHGRHVCCCVAACTRALATQSNACLLSQTPLQRLQAPSGEAPNVWLQLLKDLLNDAACREALLKGSSGAAAAPAELMLAQLAAPLAGELTATRPSTDPGTPVKPAASRPMTSCCAQQLQWTP
jgi:hypothetical protein